MSKTFSKAKMAGAIGVVAGLVGIIGFLEVYYHKWKTKDFTGKWKITCNIKSASYNPYIGKSSGWKVFFTQDGDKVNGKGELFWVDNKEIPSNEHIPIIMDGIVKGEELVLNYTLNGERRVSYGEMKISMNDEGLAEGVYSGTAANASGDLEAEKIID